MLPGDAVCRGCRQPITLASVDILRPQFDTLQRHRRAGLHYDIVRADQASADCRAAGNDQQAGYHRSKMLDMHRRLRGRS